MGSFCGIDGTVLQRERLGGMLNYSPYTGGTNQNTPRHLSTLLSQAGRRRRTSNSSSASSEY
jgi:hypothetical protein